MGEKWKRFYNNSMRVLFVKNKEVANLLIHRLIKKRLVVAIVEREEEVKGLKGKRVDAVIRCGSAS